MIPYALSLALYSIALQRIVASIRETILPTTSTGVGTEPKEKESSDR